MFASIKFLRILKKKGLAPFIPEDLYFLVEKDVSTQLSIEEPVEPDCMKYGVSSTRAVFRPHVRELVWSWLDTESRLRIVAIGRDSLLQAGLDFGTSETMYMLSILQSVEVDLQNYESVSWYLPVPSSVSLHEWLLSFRVGHLDPSVSRVADKLYSASETPRMVSALHQSCDWLLQNLTPGERPVLKKLRPCTAPGQFLLERAILCVTFLSQCLGARRVG